MVNPIKTIFENLDYVICEELEIIDAIFENQFTVSTCDAKKARIHMANTLHDKPRVFITEDEFNHLHHIKKILNAITITIFSNLLDGSISEFINSNIDGDTNLTAKAKPKEEEKEEKSAFTVKYIDFHSKEITYVTPYELCKICLNIIENIMDFQHPLIYKTIKSVRTYIENIPIHDMVKPVNR